MTNDDVSALRASAHPLRLRMLSLLTGSAMSAAEVARELDLTHANASYHLRVLLDAGELVDAGEEKIRGGIAKRYRYPHERRGEHPHVQHPSVDDRILYARALTVELERRLPDRASGMEAVEINSDLEGWVPEAAWRRARDLMAEASLLLHDQNVGPRTPGTVHFSATVWAFRMTAADDPTPAGNDPGTAQP